MYDATLVERILAARDRGVPNDAAQLAHTLGVAEADVHSALADLDAYERMLTMERAAHVAFMPDDSSPPGTRIGDYELAGELGHGAMGVVHRARQVSLDRPVALKILPSHLADDARFVARFRREATLAATVRHPHLAEVYGFVEERGTLAFAMRLVDGPTLHDVLTRLSSINVAPVRRTGTDHVRRCALLVRAIADALAVVHANGLVHRDVKPSNILLENGRGDPLDASPVLVDFGLLRPTGESTLTDTATLLGTPAYAAHECMLGLGTDARADVFSLGATLHDLLTLTSPGTRGPATAGMADARAVNPAVDARLAAIVAMALHQDRALRYEHGGALRDELDRYLRDEPIRALPSGSWARLRLWIRRDRTRAARVGTLGAITIAVVCTSVLLAAAAFDAMGTASAAARCEADGDLLGANDHYATLRTSKLAPWLRWLRDDLARSDVYHGATEVLGSTIRPLRSAPGSDSGMYGDEPSTQLRVVHDSLLRLLFNPDHADLRDTIHALLLREIGPTIPIERRIAALDTWQHYLTAKQADQPRLPDLLALLQAIVRTPAATVNATELEAATAALATMHLAAAWSELVDLLERPLPASTSKLAAAGSAMLFCWLRRDVPREFAAIDVGTIERWALAAERLGDDLRDKQWGIARAIDIWQGDNPKAAVSLPSRIDALVTESAKARDYGITDYDQTIWRKADEEWIFEAPVPWFADHGPLLEPESHLAFDRSALPPMPPTGPRTRATGTIRRVHCVGGHTHEDPNEEPAFLRFDRPGQSRVTVVTDIPGWARSLTIHVEQMPGARSSLRCLGTVHFRLSLLCRDATGGSRSLPWTYSSPAQNPSLIGSSGTSRYAVSVPMAMLMHLDQVEVLFEYLSGNTTHRLIDLQLEWLQ